MQIQQAVYGENQKQKYLQNNNNQVIDIKLNSCIYNNQKSILVQFQVSEQQKIQHQIELYQDHILSTVTHNLKTPINGILLMLGALSKLEIKSKTAVILDQIQSQTTLLLHQVLDLLDYNRILKDDKLVLHKEEIHIFNFVEEIFSLLKTDTEAKGLKLVQSIQVEQPTMYNDKSRLKQVLLALIQNSIKHTSKGQIKLEIKQIDKVIQFGVKDSGIGMSKGFIKNLQKLYGTTKQNNKNINHGVGLGLTICKKIIQNLGPTKELKIQSIPSKGTTIKFDVYRNVNFSFIDIVDSKQYKSLHSARDINLKIRNKNISHFLRFKTLNSNDMRFKTNNSFKTQQNNKLQISNQEQESQIKSKQNIPKISVNQISLKQSSSQFSSFLMSTPPITYKSSCSENISYNSENIAQDEGDSFRINTGFVKINTSIYMAQQSGLFAREFLQKQKILIVDDTKFNILALKSVLHQIVIVYIQNQDLQIEEAENGIDCIDKMFQLQQQNSAVTLLFIDIQMPNMDGKQLLKEVRQYEDTNQLNPTTIILNSAYYIDDEITNLNADFVVDKPITQKKIFNIIQSIAS